MKVISTPPNLRFVAGCFFLCIPLRIVEVVISEKTAMLNPMLANISISGFIVFLICVMLAFLTLKAKKMVVSFSFFLGSAWLVATVFHAITVKSYSLGLFSIFLFIALLIIWILLRREIGSSFIDPRMAWYQGAPSGIPYLTCEFRLGLLKQVCKDARFEDHGA
ncbi:MAG: hypothetical protein AAB116_26955, partial [Candidatus Poribacteria bacterium]